MMKGMTRVSGVTVEKVEKKSSDDNKSSTYPVNAYGSQSSSNKSSTTKSSETTALTTTSNTSTAKKLTANDVTDAKAEAEKMNDKAFDAVVEIIAKLEKILEERADKRPYCFQLNSAFEDALKKMKELAECCPDKIKQPNIEALTECIKKWKNYS